MYNLFVAKRTLEVWTNYKIICYQVPVYIAEISPQNMRGALGSVNQVCFLITILSK